MSDGFNNPVVGGGGGLVYPSIHSPNFTASTGWSIDRNGDAQFNQLTALGSIASVGPLGTGFAQVLIESGQISFGQAATQAGPFTTDAGIGLAELQDGATVETILRLDGGCIISNGAGGGLVLLPPSGDVTGLLDTSHLALFLDLGYVIQLLPGTFYLQPGVITLSFGQSLRGSGTQVTTVKGLGTGIVLAQTWPGTYDHTIRGGGITGLTVDISAMGAGSVGVQMGDIHSLEVDVDVIDTTPRGAGNQLFGVSFLNQAHWTEELHGRVQCHGCSIEFGVGGASTSSGSFKGIDIELYVDTLGNDYTPLIIGDGAHPYDGIIRFKANQSGAAAALTAAAAELSGTVPAGHPGAGAFSSVTDSILQWGPETSAGAHTPQTIIFGNASNVISDCAGRIDFGSNYTSSASYAGTGSFFGPITGDTALLPMVRLREGLRLDGPLLIHDQAAPATSAIGGQLYTDNAGKLHYLGTAGTDTVLAPA